MFSRSSCPPKLSGCSLFDLYPPGVPDAECDVLIYPALRDATHRRDSRDSTILDRDVDLDLLVIPDYSAQIQHFPSADDSGHVETFVVAPLRAREYCLANWTAIVDTAAGAGILGVLPDLIEMGRMGEGAEECIRLYGSGGRVLEYGAVLARSSSHLLAVTHPKFASKDALFCELPDSPPRVNPCFSETVVSPAPTPCPLGAAGLDRDPCHRSQVTLELGASKEEALWLNSSIIKIVASKKVIDGSPKIVIHTEYESSTPQFATFMRGFASVTAHPTARAMFTTASTCEYLQPANPLSVVLNGRSSSLSATYRLDPYALKPSHQSAFDLQAVVAMTPVDTADVGVTAWYQLHFHTKPKDAAMPMGLIVHHTFVQNRVFKTIPDTFMVCSAAVDLGIPVDTCKLQKAQAGVAAAEHQDPVDVKLKSRLALVKYRWPFICVKIVFSKIFPRHRDTKEPLPLALNWSAVDAAQRGDSLQKCTRADVKLVERANRESIPGGSYHWQFMFPTS